LQLSLTHKLAVTLGISVTKNSNLVIN